MDCKLIFTAVNENPSFRCDFSHAFPFLCGIYTFFFLSYLIILHLTQTLCNLHR